MITSIARGVADSLRTLKPTAEWTCYYRAMGSARAIGEYGDIFDYYWDKGVYYVVIKTGTGLVIDVPIDNMTVVSPPLVF